MAELDSSVSFRAFSSTQLKRACDPSDEFAFANVMVHEGGLVGFVVFGYALDEATIFTLVVQPQSQGRGLGRQLLAHTLAEFEDRGIRRCLLEVRASNAPALALYRRCGFSVDGIRKGYYSTSEGPEDAMLMSTQVGLR